MANNLAAVLLGGVLLAAGLTDLFQRKVYNGLTYPALAAGVLLHSAVLGWTGLGFSLTGAAVGGLIFFPAFWVGGMGAGDIKLMAVVGAFLGWKFALNAAVDTAVLGGMFATAYLLAKGELGPTLRRMFKLFLPAPQPAPAEAASRDAASLPYAVFIALGSAAAFFLPSFIALQ
jgi:prepilin peptidase CpaA